MENQSGIADIAAALQENKFYENRCIMISEGVTSNVAKRVIAQLVSLDLDDSKKPITIYQNSPGGEVNSGFGIYDTMRFVKSEVRVLNVGLCASIATIINLGAKKENRLSTPNCQFLIHQPLISGQVRGVAADIEITANEILKTREKINKLLAEECGQPLARVEKDAMRDYWMSAGEAVEYGLVSRIVETIGDLK